MAHLIRLPSHLQIASSVLLELRWCGRGGAAAGPFLKGSRVGDSRLSGNIEITRSASGLPKKIRGTDFNEGRILDEEILFLGHYEIMILLSRSSLLRKN